MIKLRIEKWEKAVVMQVLEMDERLRGHKYIYGGKLMGIKSANFPFLNDNCIYLRGNARDKDYDVCVQEYDSNIECDKYYDKVIQTLNEWKNSIQKTEEDSNIFEF
jgi:hypothetical protein